MFPPYFDYLIYAFLGIAPSLIWLLFYLRKDTHPEPNKMIFKVFLGGMLMGPLAIALQLVIRWFCDPTLQWSYFFAALGERNELFLLNIFLFAPLTEEFLKYAVVKWQVLRNPAFDEPVDAMIYLIISALGFAAVENIFYVFFQSDLTLRSVFSQSLARFLSAVFLHTLASGILGYYLARSLMNFKNKRVIFAGGFLLAVIVHSFYNYLAWLLDLNKNFTPLLALFLIVAGGFVLWHIKYLKKQVAVCRIR